MTHRPPPPPPSASTLLYRPRSACRAGFYRPPVLEALAVPLDSAEVWRDETAPLGGGWNATRMTVSPPAP